MLSEYFIFNLSEDFFLIDTAKLRSSCCVRKQFIDYYKETVGFIDYHQYR